MSRLASTLVVLPRAVPAITLLPIVLSIGGSNTTAVVVVVAYELAWPLARASACGLRRATPTLVAVGRNIGLSRVRLVTDVIVPAALPSVIGGIRFAWTLAWRALVAAELLVGARRGVPALAAVVAVGLAAEAALAFLERRTAARWGTT